MRTQANLTPRLTATRVYVVVLSVVVAIIIGLVKSAAGDYTPV